MSVGTRQNQWITTVALTDPATGETRNLGAYDKQTGGGVDSEESVYMAAGGERRSLGGTVTPDNVVVSRNYDQVADGANLGWILALVGRGVASITKQPTDGGFVATSRPIVWAAATLKRCTPPEVDSESNTAGQIELEFTPSGPPKVA